MKFKDEMSCNLWLIALMIALGFFGIFGVFVWFGGILGVGLLGWWLGKMD